GSAAGRDLLACLPADGPRPRARLHAPRGRPPRARRAVAIALARRWPARDRAGRGPGPRGRSVAALGRLLPRAGLPGGNESLAVPEPGRRQRRGMGVATLLHEPRALDVVRVLPRAGRRGAAGRTCLPPGG